MKIPKIFELPPLVEYGEMDPLKKNHHFQMTIVLSLTASLENPGPCQQREVGGATSHPRHIPQPTYPPKGDCSDRAEGRTGGRSVEDSRVSRVEPGKIREESTWITIWVLNQKYGKTPKMDGENNGKPC